MNIEANGLLFPYQLLLWVLKENSCKYFNGKLGAVHIDDQQLEWFEYLTLSTCLGENIIVSI